MALEYTLSTDIKSIGLIASLVINNFKIDHSKINKNERLINLNYYDTLGFNISIFEYKKNIGYLSSKFRSEISIIFRLDKNKYYDNNIELKKNIIKILQLFLILKNNFLFTFNGENLLLLKEKEGKIKINKYFAFWDSKELEDMFKGLDYKEINENGEIDYYPIK